MMAGLVLALLVPALVGAQSISSALSVYNLQTNPNPVVAGSNVTLTLQLYDSYSSVLQNVNLQLTGSYPILNFSPVSSYIITSMSQGLYGGSTQYFTYNIHIPKTTATGTYTLNLVANYETTELISGQSVEVTGQSVMPLSFYVNGAPSISVSAVSSAISPGQSASLTLDVSNAGYGEAKNVTLNLVSTPQFETQGSTRFSVGTLEQGGASVINAVYSVNSRLVNGTYQIPMYVTYSSDTGQKYNVSSNAQVSVAVNNPDVIVNITSATPSALYKGYNQSLVLSITNVGTGTAKNVSINIQPSAGIEVLSSVSKFFIGSLAAGQTTTQTLLVAANNNTGSSAAINAKVTYTSQNYASQFVQNEQLNLSVASSSTFSITAGNYSLEPGSTNMPIKLIVTNTGNIEAENVQVTFQSSYPVTPITSTYYIPSLMPGQSANVSFSVSVDSNGALGNYPVTVYETWRQPNGAVQQQYSGSNTYFATVGSGSGGSSGIIYGVVAVVVIVAVVFIARKRGLIGSKKKAGDKKK